MKTMMMIAAMLAAGSMISVRAQEKKPAAAKTETQAEAKDDNEAKVWICTGGSSRCYHRVVNCRGLESCSATVKQITVETAQKLDRRKCKVCYKPLQKKQNEN